MGKASDFLLEFTKELKERSALPKHIELSRIGPVHMASIYDELRSAVVTDSIMTGMDVDHDLAIIKGLVEMTERQAFAEGKRAGLASCQTARSDGFAAYPVRAHKNSAELARRNAHCEAIERFVWASWWDDSSLGHVMETVTANSGLVSIALLQALQKIVSLKEVVRISPHARGAPGVAVAIYFAFLDPIGVISGGAAGPKDDLESINFRALCELSRHALAVNRIRQGKGTPNTFYEERLAYFAQTEAGTKLAQSRLNSVGTGLVSLPPLLIDEVVPHALSDLVVVHRCYFQNQPPFVGGSLERLCL
jgi:hypothetical protein